MKNFIILFLFPIAASSSVFAQSIDYNIQDGYAANGYDVTEYFNQKAVKGKKSISFVFEKTTYLFSSEANKALFEASPSQYAPQYGGWCAYAMGNKGEKVNINPKTFEIRDGKLYLFYNAYFTNTLNSWKKEGPEVLKKKADVNWAKIKYKK